MTNKYIIECIDGSSYTYYCTQGMAIQYAIIHLTHKGGFLQDLIIRNNGVIEVIAVGGDLSMSCYPMEDN